MSDFNFDGFVDVADLGIVGVNFNAADMQWNTGDFNLDNMTDVADLGVLGANWSGGGRLPDAHVPDRLARARGADVRDG